MKRSHRIATAVALSLGLGLAAGAYAHPGQMGSGMGPGMQGGMNYGSQEGRMTANQLMTPEERAAFQEKMRGAQTPEARRQIAQANRTEMQKRAQDKGIALPEHRGARGRTGTGPAAAPAPQTPADTEHRH